MGGKKLLGKGSYGEVELGVLKRTGKKVAIKKTLQYSLQLSENINRS